MQRSIAQREMGNPRGAVIVIVSAELAPRAPSFSAEEPIYQNEMSHFLAALFALCIVVSVTAGVIESSRSPSTELEWSAWAPTLAVLAGLLLLVGIRARRAFFGRGRVEAKAREIAEFVSLAFLVKPCTRCQQSSFRLLRSTPQGRSLQYECLTCGRKYWAPACKEESEWIEEMLLDLQRTAERCGLASEDSPPEVRFQTAEAPLPYEVTTREPIPEPVRAEVWRRDLGRCVRCGARHGLQFDHVIPVVKGGATTAQNLQLLCQACNRKKGATI